MIADGEQTMRGFKRARGTNESSLWNAESYARYWDSHRGQALLPLMNSTRALRVSPVSRGLLLLSLIDGRRCGWARIRLTVHALLLNHRRCCLVSGMWLIVRPLLYSLMTRPGSLRRRVVPWGDDTLLLLLLLLLLRWYRW